MLVISTQNWSILAKFAKKNPAKSAVFYWLFLGEVCPRNFPWNRPIFLRICPWKSFEIWLFSAKIPRKRTIFRRILTFLPWNWPIFPRILTFFPRNRPIFREFAPENPAKFCFFFREISEALTRVLYVQYAQNVCKHWEQHMIGQSDEKRINLFWQFLGIFLSLLSIFFLKISLISFNVLLIKMYQGVF